MVLIVKVFSIAIIIYGCLLMLRPGILKKILEYMKEGNRAYIASGIKAVVGILFMFAASACSIPWIIFLLGALAALGGIAAFVIKKKVMVQMLEWAEKKPVRVIGAAALVMGILLSIAA